MLRIAQTYGKNENGSGILIRHQVTLASRALLCDIGGCNLGSGGDE